MAIIHRQGAAKMVKCAGMMYLCEPTDPKIVVLIKQRARFSSARRELTKLPYTLLRRSVRRPYLA